jgi:hypothetical protein
MFAVIFKKDQVQQDCNFDVVAQQNSSRHDGEVTMTGLDRVTYAPLKDFDTELLKVLRIGEERDGWEIESSVSGRVAPFGNFNVTEFGSVFCPNHGKE